MNNKTILGIDIGMSGALSFYDGKELIIYDMPTYKVKKGNALNIVGLHTIIKSQTPITHAYIEKAMLMPKNGKSSYQKLGVAEGALMMAMAALDIPYTIIAPSVWKKAMQCPKEKDAARMRASQLLPEFAHNWDLKKHDGRAESALIALYGFKEQHQ